MDRHARTAAALVVLVVAGIAIGLWAAGAAQVRAARPIQYTADTLYSGQQLNPSQTITSSAYTLVDNSEVQSVQYRALGTSHSVKFEVLTTLDGTTFASPDSGGTINATVTDNNWHHAALTIPLTKQVKVRVVNNSASVTATCDVMIAAQ